MEKLQIKSQNLKLLVVASLLMITPLVSTSLRLKYLYFIVNILIIAVGAEAGLLSFFLQPAAAAAASLHHVPRKPGIVISDNHDEEDDDASSEKIAAAAVKVEESTQSNNELILQDACSVEEDHELYEKSETFIGNFYKQLKMQR